MKKIGLIDSGIGGLTLLSELIKHKLDVDYCYISDTHNVPYGEKPQSFLLIKMLEMSQKLLDKNVDAIVIACNTATAETIDDLRIKFKIPIIGIEPYINYLNQSNSIAKTALILTPATARSERFKQLRQKYDVNHKIDIFVLNKLALIIEKLITQNFKDIQNDILSEIKPLYNQGYEQLILGCTHYPIIKNYLEEKLELRTVDPSKNVVKHIIEILSLHTQNINSDKFEANFDNSSVWKEYKLDNFDFLNL